MYDLVHLCYELGVTGSLLLFSFFELRYDTVNAVKQKHRYITYSIPFSLYIFFISIKSFHNIPQHLYFYRKRYVVNGGWKKIIHAKRMTRGLIRRG